MGNRVGSLAIYTVCDKIVLLLCFPVGAANLESMTGVEKQVSCLFDDLLFKVNYIICKLNIEIICSENTLCFLCHFQF